SGQSPAARNRPIPRTTLTWTSWKAGRWQFIRIEALIMGKHGHGVDQELRCGISDEALGEVRKVLEMGKTRTLPAFCTIKMRKAGGHLMRPSGRTRRRFFLSAMGR